MFFIGKSPSYQANIVMLAWKPQVSAIRFTLALLIITTITSPVIPKTVKLYDKYYLLGEKTLDNIDSAISYLQRKHFHLCHPSLLGLQIAQGMYMPILKISIIY